MLSGTWNCFEAVVDKTICEDLRQRFLGGQADSLLHYWLPRIEEIPDNHRVVLWTCAIAQEHEGWLQALWNHPGHQKDPITTSLIVIMSSELRLSMPNDKSRQMKAYNIMRRLLQPRGIKTLEEFDGETLAWALQASVMTLYIEDHELLRMFSLRPEFPYMKVGNPAQGNDLAAHLEIVFTPIVMAQEGGQNIGSILAPSMAATMRMCCQAGMRVNGTTGLSLGQILSRGALARAEVFKPLLDDWITYGGAWQTLVCVNPKIKDIVMLHPRVRAKLLNERYGRGEEHPDLPLM